MKKEARSQVKFSIWGGEETAETTFKFSICIKKKISLAHGIRYS